MAIAVTNSHKEDFIVRERECVSKFLDTACELVGLNREYDALTLATLLTDADFNGQNSGITAAQFTTAVTSVKALLTALDNSAHLANLYQVYKSQA